MRLSDGSLIDDWNRPKPVVYVEPPPLDPGVVLAERIFLAVTDLKEALASLPTPQVHIAAPDLAEVTSAVIASIPQGVDPELIGLAVAKALKFPDPVVSDNSEIVAELREAFAKLDHSMRGNRPAFGASGPSNISDNANRLLGHVTVDSMPSPLSVTTATVDYDTRFEYDSTRRAVYIGKATQGTATATASWTINKFIYGGVDGNPDRIETLTGAWDNRASLGW